MNDHLPVYTLVMPLQMIEAIGVALNEAPYRVAAPVIEAIRRQMAEQEQQFEAAKKGQSDG